MSTVDIATLGIAVDSTQVKKGAADLDSLAASGARAEKSTDGLTAASSRLAGAVGLVSGALATLGISRFVTETAALNQRYSEMGIVLDVVTRNAGLNKSAVDSVTESVRKQGISMIESRSVMTRLIQAQIDLSKATELARLAQDAAVIGQINSSDALDRMIHGITSAQVEVLRGIGINVNFERSYKELAAQMGVTVASLSENEKMQARVNVVLDQASALNGVYAASMENAGKQMRSTQRLAEDLKVKIGGLFDQTAMVAVSAYNNLLKDLDVTIESLAKSGEMKDWSHRIGVEFAGLIDLTRVFIGQFEILGKLISTQFTNIKNGDFDKMSTGFANADKALKALYADGEKYVDQVNSRVIQEKMLTEAVGRGSAATKKNSEETLNNATATATATAAKQAHVQAFDMEMYKLRQYQSDAQRVRDITDSVATKQERFNRTLEELERLRPDMSVETYNRALEKAQQELQDVGTVNKTVVNEMDQLWIQAGRNIQSALGNAVFDFFNTGLKGMVENVKNTVLRIASEFAGLKIAQSIGLSAMFAVPGSAAASGGGLSGLMSGGTSGGSSGVNLLNLASLGSSASSLFNTGFGVTTLLSKVGGMLPGSIGSLFGGMGVTGTQAAAQAGASALWGSSGVSAAASMGTSFAAVAGPAIALAAVDMLGRALAGDKKLGGAEMIPVIGGFMAALFGRGPLKQKETNLIGDFTGDGFSGITSTKFKAQGGALRSSKVDRVMVDTDTGNLLNEYKGLVEGGISKVLEPFAREAAVAAMQLGDYLDEVTTSTSTSMSKVAESLGKGKDAMEGFYYGVNIASEKGKSLTDEQISQVLADMADTMARHVIPNIDQFRKAGESAADAALRIGNEFETLVSATAVLGVSLGDARKALIGTSIDGRSAFIEAAGGVDALNSKVQYFAENFLDGSEIIKRNSELLTEQMGELGLSTSMTKEDFKNLVQSFGQVGGVSEEMLVSLLDIAPLFNQVKTAADAAGTSIESLAAKLVLTNQEAVAVGTVLGNVGYGFSTVVQALKDFSAEDIRAFVANAGGIEGLLNSSSVFADNFLTAAQKTQFQADYLAQRLTGLGLSANISAESFRDLIMGQGEFANASKELRAQALLLTGDFIKVKGGMDGLSGSLGGLGAATQTAAVSVNDLIQIGLNFGLSMQKIGSLIGSSTQDQLNAWAANNPNALQQSEFFKQNFLTPLESFNADAQKLANDLSSIGIDSNVSRSGFAAILQDFSDPAKQAAASNLMQLYDSVHDRMEASAQAAADFVAPVAQILNQDAINAANDNIRNAQSAMTQAQNEVNQARQNEINLLQQTADKFRGYEQAMKNASNALAISDASPLSPVEKYQEAQRQLRQAAQSGDYEKLQQAGSAFLDASRTVNASGSQYTQDYQFVKGLYDQAAAAAGKQASDAEKQLGALGTINNSVMSVAQAVNNLAAAQAAYKAAQSSVPAPIYSTPNVTPPSVLSMPAPGGQGIAPMPAPSNVLPFPSDAQINDFVKSNYGDWKAIYDEAIKYQVSSERLSSASGLPLADIRSWVESQGLPMFERGTDYVKSGGLAILHKAEAVTPASSMSDMASSIAALTAENREIRKQLEESNRKLSSLIGTVAKSSDKNADRIVRNSDKQSFYREVRRA